MAGTVFGTARAAAGRLADAFADALSAIMAQGMLCYDQTIFALAFRRAPQNFDAFPVFYDNWVRLLEGKAGEMGFGRPPAQAYSPTGPVRPCNLAPAPPPAQPPALPRSRLAERHCEALQPPDDAQGRAAGRVAHSAGARARVSWRVQGARSEINI